MLQCAEKCPGPVVTVTQTGPGCQLSIFDFYFAGVRHMFSKAIVFLVWGHGLGRNLGKDFIQMCGAYRQPGWIFPPVLKSGEFPIGTDTGQTSGVGDVGVGI